jgi:uncharacterized protein with NRDE domain
LLVVALGVVPRLPLVLAANRDERHARPTSRAAWWPDRPTMLAGRDLAAGGTWLAMDRRGRVAAVTNIRDERRDAPRSRGSLVTEFVGGDAAAEHYAISAAASAAEFGAFHLLVFDGRELHYASDRAPPARIGPGVHALSNAPPGIVWPKVESARIGATKLLDDSDPVEGLFALLADRGSAGTSEERYRSAHFVIAEGYGTRCSTVVLIDAAGNATFAERTFDATGEIAGEVRETFMLRRSAS